MTRLQYNLQIMKLLRENLSLDALRVVDYNSTCENFAIDYETMIEDLKLHKDFRFIQYLWALNYNLIGRDGQDRFYEESEETYNKLREFLK